MNLGCSIDREYRRVNKRLKIKELIDKLAHFRRIANGSGASPDTNGPDINGSQDDSASPINASQGVYLGLDLMRHENDVERRRKHELQRDAGGPTTSHAEDDAQSAHQTLSQVGSPSPPGTCTARSIDHMFLTSQQINDLFQRFFEHYHQMLEILDPSIQPDLYFARSPLLFWSIISIACRHYEEDSTLLPSLAPCVSRLLWKTLGVLPHSGFTVQALLLLSAWPTPTSSMSTDTSFLYVSIAKTSAMQLGLHRPDTVQDFLRVKTQLGPAAFLDAVRTYIGCYICAETLTSNIGQPSLFQDESALGVTVELGHNFTVPENLHLNHVIVRFVGRLNRALADNLRSSQPIESLLRLLEGDLDELKKRHSERFSAIHHISLQTAYLQLYTYYFFCDTGSHARKEGLLKCYNTSLDLISKASEADKQSNFMIYSPNYYCQSLTSAASVVLKILYSSYGKCIHSDGGKRAFNAVLSLLRRSSIENNDLSGRGCMILTQLWSLYQLKPDQRHQEPSLRVRTRYAASILHDALWTWREEVGSQAYVIPQSTVSLSSPSESHANPESLGQEMPASMAFDGETQHTGSGAEPFVDNAVNITGTNLGTIPDSDWVWNIGFPTLLMEDNLYMAAPTNLYEDVASVQLIQR